MLKVRGRVRRVRKAGIASSASSQGIKRTAVIIRKPTMIRAGAVTGETRMSCPPSGFGIGTEPPITAIKGENGSASRKSSPTTTLVRPVRQGPAPAAYRGGVEAAADDVAGQWHDSEDHADQAGDEDADDDAASKAAGDEGERQGEPEGREQNRASRELPEPQVRDRVGSHDAGILQADKGDKEPDTDGDGELQAERDGVHDRFAKVCKDEDGNEEALYDYGGHRCLPRELLAQDQGEGHDRVEAQTRSKGDREVRDHAHRDARRRRRDARCEEYARHGETGPVGAENSGVDKDYVRHRHKGREPRYNLRSEVRPPLGELKETAQDRGALRRQRLR